MPRKSKKSRRGGQLYGQSSSSYSPSSYGQTQGTSSYLDSAGNTVKNGFNTLSDSVSQGWNSITGAFSSSGNNTQPTFSQNSRYSNSSGLGFGGKRGGRGKMMMAGRGKMMMMGGNFSPNTPLTGLAAYAEPISGVPTASAQMVGGRTRRRRNKHRKSCKKSCRKH